MDKWSDDIELLLERIRRNCMYRSEYHRKNFYAIKSREKYFNIPLIILSSSNSVLAVSLTSFVSQTTTSLVNCAISLFCGILSSIALYLNIEDGMKLELELSKQFYTLAIKIFKTLHLTREKRSSDGKEYLETIFTNYSQLCVQSKLLKSKYRNDNLLHENCELDRSQPNTPTIKTDSSEEYSNDFDV